MSSSPSLCKMCKSPLPQAVKSDMQNSSPEIATKSSYIHVLYSLNVSFLKSENPLSSLSGHLIGQYGGLVFLLYLVSWKKVAGDQPDPMKHL